LTRRMLFDCSLNSSTFLTSMLPSRFAQATVRAADTAQLVGALGIDTKAYEWSYARAALNDFTSTSWQFAIHSRGFSPGRRRLLKSLRPHCEL
jgi:hypothetical protein